MKIDLNNKAQVRLILIVGIVILLSAFIFAASVINESNSTNSTDKKLMEINDSVINNSTIELAPQITEEENQTSDIIQDEPPNEPIAEISQKTITSSLNPDATYTKNSETICDGDTCTTQVYGFNAFTEYDGEWYTFSDLASLTWQNNEFVLTYKDLSLEIEPFVIYNGEYRAISDLENTFAGTSFEGVVSASRFSNKFTLNINTDSSFANSVDNLGFRIKNVKGANSISKDDLSTILDDIEINFNDLEDSGYTVDLTNSTYLLISSVSDNYENGKISLDPVITLDSDDAISWSRGQDSDSYGFHIMYGLSEVPAGANVVDSVACYMEPCSACLSGPDGDLNMTRYNEYGTVFGNWNSYTDNQANQSSQNWFNISGGSTLEDNGWWCSNATTQVRASLEEGINNVSLRYTDPDAFLGNITSAESKDTILRFGWKDGFLNKYRSFASPQHSNTTVRPFMNITYTSETNSPQISILSPANETLYSQGTNQTFSCYVSDDTEVDNVYFYSDFRNGTWMLEGTNSSGINDTDYNFTFNFTGWLDGETVIPSISTYGIAYNGTDWWRVSGSSNVTHYGPDRSVVGTFYSPSTWLRGIDAWDDKLIMLDIVSQDMYYYWSNGTEISNCNVGSAITGTIVSGISHYNDSLIYLVTDAGSYSNLNSTNLNCDNLDIDFKLPETISPQEADTDADTLYILDSYYSADLIQEYSLSDGSYSGNISAGDILDCSGTCSEYGLSTIPSESTAKTIFTMTNSPAELTQIVLRDSGSMQWYCSADDIYSNENQTETYTFYFSNETQNYANETEGRDAIEEGIYNATPSATIYTDLEVDVRHFDGTQENGVFDKVSFNGTQRWGFNYVTDGESFTNIANSSYYVFNVWEDESLTISEIFDAVKNFIENTLS